MKQDKRAEDTSRWHRRGIPVPSKGEVAVSIGKIVATSAPQLVASQSPVFAVASVLVGELLSLITGSILSKRQRDTVQELEDGFRALQSEHLELTEESLQHNEALVSAIWAVVPAMLRTEYREKREALRNVVLHAALPESVEEGVLRRFIDDIDALEPWHLDLLQCIADPLAWAKRREYSVHQPRAGIDALKMFEAWHRGRLPVEGYERAIVTDLYNRGLATSGVDPYGPPIVRDEGSTVPHLTALGKQFLAYVASPISEHDKVE